MANDEAQQADLAELFNFDDASMPETLPEVINAGLTVANTVICNSHDDNCPGLCNEESLCAPKPAPVDCLRVPKFLKPQVACDYCKSRKLECFFFDEGQMTCNPCSALFRTCSFTQTCEELQRPADAIDTLHALDENAAFPWGALTGTKRLKSNLLGRHNRPSTPTNDDAERGRKNGTRFSKASLKILKDWMEEHRGNPYPTEEEKEMLKNSTGLSSRQISDWLANTRRREKNKMPKRAASPSIRPSTEAINVPEGRTWNDLNPFERWKHSPPENEPAPLAAIENAVRDFSPPLSGESSASSYRHHDSSASNSLFSARKAPSTTSLETGSKLSASGFSSGSFNSHRTAWSHGSRNSGGSFGSFNSFGHLANKDRRRRRRATGKPAQPDASKARPFQCTFCTDRFKSKYDWSRHEKSLHLSLEKWICAPLGPTITLASGQRQCAYCELLEPPADHAETHNHRACEEKGIEARTFYRKDHLRQHLRLMHGSQLLDSMETWKAETVFIRSRCGFCDQKFAKWQDRVDHLAKEFKSGKQMKQWKGCRGLDPHIAALVTNAMPPYLIDNESKAPVPFSASNTASLNLYAQYSDQIDLEAIIPNAPSMCFNNDNAAAIESLIKNLDTAEAARFSPLQYPFASDVSPTAEPLPPAATCWEYTTLKLGQWTRQQLAKGMIPSDADLQLACRQLIYDSDDSWNQTPADNDTWLSLFKKSHGLVYVPDDFDRIDALEDLGMGREMSVAYEGLTAQPTSIPTKPCGVFQGDLLNLGDYYSTFDDNGMLLKDATMPCTTSSDVPVGNGFDFNLGFGSGSNSTSDNNTRTTSMDFSEMPAFQLDEDLFSDMTHLGLDTGLGTSMEGVLDTSLPATTGGMTTDNSGAFMF